MSKNDCLDQLRSDYESGMYTNACLEDKYHYSKGYVSSLAKKNGWVKTKSSTKKSVIYDTKEDLKQSASNIRERINEGDSISQIGKKVGLPYDVVKNRAISSLSLKDVLLIIDTQIANNNDQIRQLTNANDQLNVIRKFAVEHLSEEQS